MTRRQIVNYRHIHRPIDPPSVPTIEPEVSSTLNRQIARHRMPLPARAYGLRQRTSTQRNVRPVKSRAKRPAPGRSRRNGHYIFNAESTGATIYICSPSHAPLKTDTITSHSDHTQSLPSPPSRNIVTEGSYFTPTCATESSRSTTPDQSLPAGV